jgi:hypothetical protein
MRLLSANVILSLVLLGCGSAPGHHPATGGESGEGGAGGETPTGGKTGATGGRGSVAPPVARRAPRAARRGRPAARPARPAVRRHDRWLDRHSPDAAPGDSGGATGGASGTGGMPGMTAPGQGPTALGKIVYSQDFENGMEGMSRSPGNLPADRVQIVDDPLNKRGKVVKIVWQSGDNYRTSSGTQPRSWFSNAMGYQVKPAPRSATPGASCGPTWPWTPSSPRTSAPAGLGAAGARQRPLPGPVQPVRRQQPRPDDAEPNRWYDFRVDMDWTGGGKVQFFVDGQMAYQSTMGGASANCHWDGGIYNTPGGTATNKTRTVYLSNLSVGER